MSLITHDIDRIADEYVLGLLDDDETFRVEQQLEANTALRAAIAAARERFLPLDISVEDVAPSALLWQRIDAGLDSAGPARSTPHPPPASNDNRLSFWKRTAATSVAASLLLAAGLGWSLTRQIEPVVVAILLNDAGEPQAIVEDFSDREASIKLLADFAVPEGKTLQVWTLPSRDMGPVSLGLLDNRRSARLATPPLPRPKNEQLYEITLEQQGGSPTGKPTGPILVKGFGKIPL